MMPATRRRMAQAEREARSSLYEGAQRRARAEARRLEEELRLARERTGDEKVAEARENIEAAALEKTAGIDAKLVGRRAGLKERRMKSLAGETMRKTFARRAFRLRLRLRLHRWPWMVQYRPDPWVHSEH